MKPGDGRALSGLHRPDLPARVCPTCNARFFGGEEFCPIDGARLNDPGAAAARPRHHARTCAILRSGFGTRPFGSPRQESAA